MEKLKTSSKNEAVVAINLDDIDNPLREPSESGTSPILSDPGPLQLFDMGQKARERQPPGGMEGYLLKKSPVPLVGWQRRYFVIRDSGEMIYYMTVSEKCRCVIIWLVHIISNMSEVNTISTCHRNKILKILTSPRDPLQLPISRD